MLEGDILKDIHFDGSGCAISKSSASIMTQLVKGKTIAEIREIFNVFQHLVTAPMDEEADAEKLGKLIVFAGVKEFPSRVKCASLAWHTMLSAFENKSKIASTE